MNRKGKILLAVVGGIGVLASYALFSGWLDRVRLRKCPPSAFTDGQGIIHIPTPRPSDSAVVPTGVVAPAASVHADLRIRTYPGAEHFQTGTDESGHFDQYIVRAERVNVIQFYHLELAASGLVPDYEHFGLEYYLHDCSEEPTATVPLVYVAPGSQPGTSTFLNSITEVRFTGNAQGEVTVRLRY